MLNILLCNNIKTFTTKYKNKYKYSCFNNSYQLHKNYSTLQYFLCELLRRYGLISNPKNTPNFVLNALGAMPKRIKSLSKLPQRTKKSKQAILSQRKRTSIPRSCKITTAPKKTGEGFNYLSMISSQNFMGGNQIKVGEKGKKSGDKEKEYKTEKSGFSNMNWSSDELDVVFDVQEEKKNKVYEVITVMSDDETPNKISYERIYADDPEKTVVKSDLETHTLDALNNDDVVAEIVKEVNLLKNNIKESSKTESNSAGKTIENIVINNDKDDSDNEVVCVGVLDAKTKNEQKKANIEEICLSSDSETGSRPTVPPIRLKIPFSAYPYVNKCIENDESESSFESNNSNIALNLKQNRLRPYFCKKTTGTSNSMCGWNSSSSSSSPKASSSDEISPAPTDSPKVLSGDETYSSALSDFNQPKHKSNHSSDNENSSSPSSSSDEEKDIYWKADRETRRKGELRYEEFTDLGKKIHEGEAIIDNSNSFTFKVMSYNVLAQNLLEQHMYLYKNHDRRALSWIRRWTLIYNEIKDENPEILCLQEVEQSHLLSHYAKLYDLGYRWVYKKRTSHYQDGVAVFYKTAVFEDDDHALVEFYQPGVSVLDRDNVGVVVRLRLKDYPSHALVVATTHLLYNPRRSDVKLAQTQVLLAEIDRLAYNKDALTYYPVIVTGDFNLKPLNGVHTLMTEGHLTYEGMSRRTLRTPEDHNILPKTLLPCRIGITDRCQHVDVLKARVRGDDTNKTKLYHSEHNKDPYGNSQPEDCSKDDRFESGSLYHGFNFQSAYAHKKEDGQREASTHHDNWLTVDYIFYSTPKVKDGQKKEEGSLQLLSRLRMPTQDECERFIHHLPNFAFGSDHLPLVTKFLLRLH